jgi:hypothetical protein
MDNRVGDKPFADSICSSIYGYVTGDPMQDTADAIPIHFVRNTTTRSEPTSPEQKGRFHTMAKPRFCCSKAVRYDVRNDTND